MTADVALLRLAAPAKAVPAVLAPAAGTVAPGDRFVVAGYVRATTGIPARQWINRLLDDIRRCLIGDQNRIVLKLGPQLVALQRDLNGEELTDQGVLAPRGLFQQPWEAIYHLTIPDAGGLA